MSQATATLARRDEFQVLLNGRDGAVRARRFETPSVNSGQHLAYRPEVDTGYAVVHLSESLKKSALVTLWTDGGRARPFNEVDQIPEAYADLIEEGATTFGDPEFYFLWTRASSNHREALPAIRLLGSIAESLPVWRPRISQVLLSLLKHPNPEIRSASVMAIWYIDDSYLKGDLERASKSEQNAQILQLMNKVINYLA